MIQSFEMIQKKQKIPLLIICRKAEMKIIKESFPKYKNFNWLTIIHAKKNELSKYYNQARLAIIPKIKIAYNELSLSFKILEYLSYGLPIVASDNFEQIKLIKENELGINIGSTKESYSKNIIRLYNDTELLNKYHNNSLKFIKNKGLWKHRVNKIINTYRKKNDA